MNEKKITKWITSAMVLFLLCSMVLLSKEAALYVNGKSKEKERITIVIDSGHGGKDPGKIAANGALEKDINLAIALKLQQYLEAADLKVIMTRTTDTGLYEENASSKKAQDMKNRVALIEECSATLAISIHQNSYSDPSVHGAQVFYYASSSSGKALAEALQNTLVSKLDPENHRKAKSNDNYYLLKKTSCPTVIVECGFLSNPAEAAKLCSEGYQDELAWTLHLAILQYINQQ